MALNGHAGGGDRLPVVIRAMGARDVPGLLRMRGGVVHKPPLMAESTVVGRSFTITAARP